MLCAQLTSIKYNVLGLDVIVRGNRQFMYNNAKSVVSGVKPQHYPDVRLRSSFVLLCGRDLTLALFVLADAHQRVQSAGGAGFDRRIRNLHRQSAGDLTKPRPFLRGAATLIHAFSPGSRAPMAAIV